MKQLHKVTIWPAFGVFALASLPQLVSAATLTINGCESLTVVDANTITCSSSVVSPGAPTGCTVSPSSVPLPSSGGDVIAPTVSCAGGGALSKVSWTRSQTPVIFPDTLPPNALTSQRTYTYSGLACTADNVCTPVSYSATVAANGNEEPSSASCGNLKKIIPTLEGNPSITTLAFTGLRYLTSGFAGNDKTIVVARIDVPADLTGPTTLKIAEYGSLATNRKAWLSKSECDTSGTALPYHLSTNTPSFNIQTGPTTTSSLKVWMQPNETWYLMIKNEKWGLTNTESSCKTGTCDIAVKLNLPTN